MYYSGLMEGSEGCVDATGKSWYISKTHLLSIISFFSFFIFNMVLSWPSIVARCLVFLSFILFIDLRNSSFSFSSLLMNHNLNQMAIHIYHAKIYSLIYNLLFYYQQVVISEKVYPLEFSRDIDARHLTRHIFNKNHLTCLIENNKTQISWDNLTFYPLSY